MKLQLVRASRGALWVRQGFVLFFKQPVAFAGLFATFMFAVFVLTLVPFIGSLLVLAALPLASLGFMIATRAAMGGRFALPGVFIEPLRGPRPRVLAIVQLGLLYAAATYTIIWLSDMVDGGALDRLLDALSSGKADQESLVQKLSDTQLQAGLLLRFGLAGLLSVPFWHAPALVHWGQHSVGKALFSSTVAVWRNRGAFAVYSLVWFAVIMLFAFLANLVFGLLGQTQLVALAAMPASLIFSTVFYASLYFTFADCFAPDAADAESGSTAVVGSSE
jgi:hypothetical protein